MTTTTGWLAEPIEGDSIQRVQLDDRSWVDVIRDFMPRGTDVHDELLVTTQWQQGRVFRYERYIDEPRLGSWIDGRMTHPALAEAGDWISDHYGTPFDGAGLALYRNGNDAVGFHRDRELIWLEDTLIAVLTLGATRPWLVKPLGRGRDGRDPDFSDTLDFMPASGDLIVMGGRTQSAWLHGVPGTATPCGSRISVQWRWTSRQGKPDQNPGFYDARLYSR
jgi:alkylated DNA repair dioxygenase AlkB